jgi:hypothetical protein
MPGFGSRYSIESGLYWESRSRSRSRRNRTDKKIKYVAVI